MIIFSLKKDNLASESIITKTAEFINWYFIGKSKIELNDIYFLCLPRDKEELKIWVWLNSFQWLICLHTPTLTAFISRHLDVISIMFFNFKPLLHTLTSVIKPENLCGNLFSDKYPIERSKFDKFRFMTGNFFISLWKIGIPSRTIWISLLAKL